MLKVSSLVVWWCNASQLNRAQAMMHGRKVKMFIIISFCSFLSLILWTTFAQGLHNSQSGSLQDLAYACFGDISYRQVLLEW
jgi:hypothetical protein